MVGGQNSLVTASASEEGSWEQVGEGGLLVSECLAGCIFLCVYARTCITC